MKEEILRRDPNGKNSIKIQVGNNELQEEEIESEMGSGHAAAAGWWPGSFGSFGSFGGSGGTGRSVTGLKTKNLKTKLFGAGKK